VGRASNRKKAQRRQTGPSLRRINQDARSLAQAQRSGFDLDTIVRLAKGRVERRHAALRAWFGDTEPVPAEVPPWPEGSLGYRLLAGTSLGEAQDAPSLPTAQIPDAKTITADPTHWNIAVDALIRAVVFDELTPDHPAVSTLLEVLAPVAEAELAHMQAMHDELYSIGPFHDDGGPGFPELDGPVYLLGGQALMDATWAVVGEDSLSDVMGVLLPTLDAVVPDPGGRVVADALIGAFAAEYTCDQPGDAEMLKRIGPHTGNALEDLATDENVPPSDLLRLGLTALSALARLCQSGSRSVLQRAWNAN
jgi:hypothetical protein